MCLDLSCCCCKVWFSANNFFSCDSDMSATDGEGEVLASGEVQRDTA